MKKVVCIGGGNSIPKCILPELKKHGVQITTITSMVDSGGSAGAFRDEFKVLPPGDIRRHILALSEAPEWKKKLWQFRFANGITFDDHHQGHNFANAFIGGLEHITGDYAEVLEIVHEFMEVRNGKCLPATIDHVDVVARLEDGTVVKGEDNIDVLKDGRNGKLKITDLWLEPRRQGVEPKAFPEAVQAVKEADLILIGPGDLYSSVLPCFMPNGMREAFQESRAKKVFIAPAMTKFGETFDYDLEDFAAEVERFAGVELDFVVFNDSSVPEQRVSETVAQGLQLQKLVRPRSASLAGKFVGLDIVQDSGAVLYDANKLVPAVLELARK